MNNCVSYSQVALFEVMVSLCSVSDTAGGSDTQNNVCIRTKDRSTELPFLAPNIHVVVKHRVQEEINVHR